MSTTIEEKVVEMRFDNRQFEQNVQTSISTVEKLKQSLNLTGAAKGLDSVNNAAKNVDMSGLGSAVETVRAKFSALDVIGVTALSNITNSAVNAGKRLISSLVNPVKELTVGSVKTGFNEYETKINSIQTIMSNTASKGTTMEDVTRVIGELNTYADKTIYNFAEMTRNIGTFTAAGVGLEESASAIQGIANLAASSGSTSQQASTAMYQLSQAMSTGVVKLMDWNSVVNAGMGGEKFQEALKATAREYGVSVDEIIEKNGSFRDSLQDGWLTADILSTTLQKFTTGGADEYAKKMVESGEWTQKEADALKAMAQEMEDAATKVKTFTQLWDTLKEAAQSGWAQSWEIIVGDFEEAKELFTQVSDVIGGMIGKSAEARNKVLQGWKDLGGRQAIVDGLKYAFEGVMNIIKPIGEAFKEIFPPVTAEQLLKFSEGFRDLMERFKNATASSDTLTRTFKGLFALINIGKQIVVALWTGIKPLLGVILKLGGYLLTGTAYLGDWLVKLNDATSRSNVFKAAMQTIVDVVTKVVNAIKDFAGKFKIPALELFHATLDRIKARMTDVGDAAGGMKDGVVTAVDKMGSALEGCAFFKFLQAVWNGVKLIGSVIGEVFGKLTGGLIDKLGNANFSGIFDFINSISFSAIAIFFAKFVKGFEDITETVGSFKESALDILDSVRGCFEAYQTQLKANTLLKIAGAIAILVASIVVLSFVDSKKLAASLGAITVLFADLMGGMAIFGKVGGSLGGVYKATKAMTSIAIAVLILAVALKTVSGMSVEEMTTGLIGIITLTATVVAAAKILASDGKKAIKGATQMVIFAAAVKILASACKDISKLSWSELAKGLVGVGALLAGISIFLRTAKFSAKSILTATGIVILAGAIKILGSACKDFGAMSKDTIIKGLVSIGAILAELIVFTNLTGNAKHVISTGIALIAIGAAMKIFASAMKDMSGMSYAEIGRSLVGMAGALLAITAAVNFMPNNMVGKGVGLIAISTALLILSSALKGMGGMSWDAIARGLVALGGAMAILAIGLNVMKGTLMGSAALLVASAALMVLAPVLALLGSMSWESIGKGLLAIAGAFVILGVAGFVLGPLTPVILALAGALVLIGIAALGVSVALVLAGAGLTAIATAITLLGTAMSVSATAITAGLIVIVTGLAGLIPLIATKIGEGIVALCVAISQSAGAICEAITAVLLAVIEAINAIAPPLFECLGSLLDLLLNFLIEYVPKIVEAGVLIILGLLEGIASNIQDITATALLIIEEFLRGIAEGLPGVIDAAIELAISFINGLADGIRDNTDAMISAVNNLMDAFIGALIKWFANIYTKGSEIRAKLVEGIKSKISELLSAGKELIDKVLSGIKNKASDLWDAGADAIQGFINGIKSKISSAASAAASVGASALNSIKSFLGINSPSREFAEVGMGVDEGLVKGMKDYSGMVVKASRGVGETALDTMKSTMSRISDVINSDIDSQPTIRPVLDLDGVRSGANKLNSMLALGSTIGMSANVGAVSAMMNNRSQNGANGDIVSELKKLRSDFNNMDRSSYNINGVTYDDGSNIANAVKTITRAAKVARRV